MKLYIIKILSFFKEKKHIFLIKILGVVTDDCNPYENFDLNCGHPCQLETYLKSEKILKLNKCVEKCQSNTIYENDLTKGKLLGWLSENRTF